MSIFDRYIVTTFLKIFLVCFVSFTGLFVIVDAFTNLEEFLDLSEKTKLSSAIVGHYLPRVLQFFDRMAPLIALVASIFTVALMQRNNELTAVSAGGISRKRIVLPILVTCIVIVAVAAVNRETLIPAYRNQLAMKVQDLAAGKGRSFGIAVDHSTGISIRGKEVMPVENTIEAPEFTLPPEMLDQENTPQRIAADSGTYLSAQADRPAGYLLSQVSREIRDMPDVVRDERTVVYSGQSHEWLGEDQVFVAAKIDTMELAFPKELARYSTLPEMIEGNRQPATSWSNQRRVDVHWRIIQPIFDLTLVLIGLPLVISRGERSLFVAASVCLLLVMLMILVVIGSHAMGAARIVSPPSLAAWLPVLIFLPIAFVMYRLLDR